MEDFVRGQIDPFVDDALQSLLAIGRNRFDGSNIPVEFVVRWWPRFKVIACSFLDWQRSHLPEVKSIHVELKGMSNGGLAGFTLSGRADRIDLLKGGQLAIFDYKTGTNPTVKSVVDFKSPQLPLEAALALRGGFGKQFQHETAQLGYVRLRPTNPLAVDLIGGDGSKTLTASALAEVSWERLGKLITAYRDPAKDYRSKARQAADRGWEDDYDHLARVREWSVSDDGEDEA